MKYQPEKELEADVSLNSLSDETILINFFLRYAYKNCQ